MDCNVKYKGHTFTQEEFDSVKPHEMSDSQMRAYTKYRSDAKKLPTNETITDPEAFADMLDNGMWSMVNPVNPDGVVLAPEQADILNNKAAQWFARNGMNAIPAATLYGGAGTAFFVPNMTPKQAHEFAVEFKQDSVMTSEGVVYRDGTMHPRKPGHTMGQAGDMVSSIKLGTQVTPFQVDYDTDRVVGNGFLELPGQMSESAKEKFQIIGENANVAEDIKMNLNRARLMEMDGKDATAIYHATGWERGIDGKWRYDVQPMSLNKDAFDKLEVGKEVPLTDVVDPSDPIFKLYPQLTSVKFKKEPQLWDLLQATQGWRESDTNTIVITPYADSPRSTFVHEVQHVIQEIEGFRIGASTNNLEKFITDENAINFLPDVFQSIENEQRQLEKDAELVDRLLFKDPELIEAIDTAYQKLYDEYDNFIKQEPKPDTLDNYDFNRHLEKIKSYKVEYGKPLGFDVLYEMAKLKGVSLKELETNALKEVESVIEKIKDKHMMDTWTLLPLLSQRMFLSNANYLGSSSYAIETFNQKVEKQFNEIGDKLQGLIDPTSPGFKKTLIENLPQDLKFKIYRRVAGEVEARNVQERMGFTPEERRARPISETEEYSREEQVGADQQAAIFTSDFDKLIEDALKDKTSLKNNLSNLEVRLINFISDFAKIHSVNKIGIIDDIETIEQRIDYIAEQYFLIKTSDDSEIVFTDNNNKQLFIEFVEDNVRDNIKKTVGAKEQLPDVGLPNKALLISDADGKMEFIEGTPFDYPVVPDGKFAVMEYPEGRFSYKDINPEAESQKAEPMTPKKREMFQIIGENAHIADNVRANLRTARDMETSGTDAKTIRIATGWERGKDGMWRYEILDGDLKIKDSNWYDTQVKNIDGGVISNLKDVLNNNELYTAYPDLEKIQVVFNKDTNVGNASFTDNTIYLPFDQIYVSKETLKSLLLHEVQHAIQQIEGFAIGGSPNSYWSYESFMRKSQQEQKQSLKDQIDNLKQEIDKTKNYLKDPYISSGVKQYYESEIRKNESELKSLEYVYKTFQVGTYTEAEKREAYNKLAGEVEARNAQFRMNMSPEQRRETMLQDTEDVARNEQIVIFDSLGGTTPAMMQEDVSPTPTTIKNNEPLPGVPSVPGFHGPDPKLVSVAEQYAINNGINLQRQAEYVKVDTERAKRIADAYDNMPHAPQDPVVKEAYENLIKQTTAQYEALVDSGYEFWFMDMEDSTNVEYASSPFNALRDLRSNKQMGVYPTTEGYGTREFDVDDNPMLASTPFEWSVGKPGGPKKPVLANDLFRAVHDAFGHGLEGAGFRARGEENAWQAHVRLFTGSAVAAMTSETRGQNSWLNYGPYGETNRTAKVEDTVFADQKIGLMPEWTWQEGVAPNMDDVNLEQAPTPLDQAIANAEARTRMQDVTGEPVTLPSPVRITEASQELNKLFRRDGIPLTVQEAADILKHVESWRTWYEGIETLIQSEFQEYGADFSVFLYSSAVAANSKATVGSAFRGLQNFYNQKDIGGLAQVSINIFEFLLKGTMDSKKIDAFIRAAAGDPDAIAVDSHIWAFMHSKKKLSNPSTDADFDKAKKFVRDVADVLGWQPRQVQAAMWAADILRLGGSPDTYEQYIKNKLNERNPKTKKTWRETINDWRSNAQQPFLKSIGDGTGTTKIEYARDVDKKFFEQELENARQAKIDEEQRAKETKAKNAALKAAGLPVPKKSKKKTERFSLDNDPINSPKPLEMSDVVANQIAYSVSELTGNTNAPVVTLSGNDFSVQLANAQAQQRATAYMHGAMKKHEMLYGSETFQQLIRRGVVNLAAKIRDFAGLPMLTNHPDSMQVGMIGNVRGQGGYLYAADFNTGIWAFAGSGGATTFVKYINKQVEANGRAFIAFTKGGATKNLSSLTGATGTYNVMLDFANAGAIDKKILLDSFAEVYNVTFPPNATDVEILDILASNRPGTFNKRSEAFPKLVTAIKKKVGKDKSKFNLDKMMELLQYDDLRYIDPNLKDTMPTDDLYKAIGMLFTEELATYANVGDVVMIMEVKGKVFKEVQGQPKNKTDDDTQTETEQEHESYGVVVKLEDPSDEKVKLHFLEYPQYVANILNDTENNEVSVKDAHSAKFGQNNYSHQKSVFVKSEEQLNKAELITSPNNEVLGFVQNGRIFLNGDKVNTNTTLAMGAQIWLDNVMDQRPELYEQGMEKIEGSPYLDDVKNSVFHQRESLKHSPGEAREAYFKKRALMNAIADEGEKMINATKKKDFKEWVKSLWSTVSELFGIRDRSIDDIKNMTLGEFSKLVAADILTPRQGQTGKMVKSREELGPDVDINDLMGLAAINPEVPLEAKKERFQMAPPTPNKETLGMMPDGTTKYFQGTPTEAPQLPSEAQPLKEYPNGRPVYNPKPEGPKMAPALPNQSAVYYDRELMDKVASQIKSPLGADPMALLAKLQADKVVKKKCD